MGTNSNSISGGTFHGPVLQAGSVHLPKPQPAPFGLPARSVFVGRERQLAKLAEALGADGELVAVSALAGLGGVGKTALAVEAAYRARELFPGGILFIDLRGYDEARLTADQALDTLLHALGETPPPGLPAKQQRYRSVLAALPAPLLLIADNASTADQITPLLPGDPRHRVLVTSRHTLADRTLAPRHLTLDTLTEAESVALLTELAGPDPAHPELAELCGHLPLALRITAALLTDRTPTELVADLADTRERLTELDHGPDFAVRAAFDLSHRRLTPEEARLFALLPHAPGQDIALPAATALADRTPRGTARLLRGLTRAHLLQHSHGRYRLHDLVRLYAADCPTTEAAAARARVTDYYLDTAAAIRTAQQDPTAPGLTGWRATQWLREELDTLREVWTATTDGTSPDPGVVGATFQVALVNLALIAGFTVRYVLAGQREPDKIDHVLRYLDTAAPGPSDLPEDPYATALTEATEHARTLCHLAAELPAHPHPELTSVALPRLHHLLALCRRLGETGLTGEILLTLGDLRAQLGHFPQATADLTAAVTAFESTGDPDNAARARALLAQLPD
ncbi:hypothetical protein CFP65_5455 [Kitasatospora sp. MMS16-BH015]|uniref:hypothetical protein n=1 Tax=Kitasatospora sp. MMS16-BH015 TaxID=2018025 RepID=UPI000CA23EF2|nr:hypothetical protein [Kitasatospora sp. MMS16-BH015]AUG80157.1 hypothetical protein CFP65_5455 [Kitasatospora sp. MMS16-BH015]